MAGAQFEYDEKGTTFYYFLLSFFGIVLVPLTYYIWKVTKLPGEAVLILYVSYLSVLAVLWVLFFVGAYKISQFEKDFTEYDPYAVLELDRGSSTADIRRQYRRLSMKYHPDKETGDPQKFMRIAKAYEALTNEESRKNWEEHGNPDGPGATSFGIALPSWLVSKENSMWVLGAYGLAFMVILPIAVGTWWYKSIQYSCEQILLDTTQLYYYFFHKTPSMHVKRVLMILGGSLEFEKGHNREIQERPSDNIELPELMRDLTNLGDKNKEPPLCYPYSIKARALIHAHLSRLELPRDTLKPDFIFALSAVHYSKELLYHDARLNLMKNIKSCWILLQRNVQTIKQLAVMNQSNRRSMLNGLTDQEYDDVMTVCSMFPVIEMDVKPHVLDDEEDEGVVTTGSIVTVAVTLKRRNLGASVNFFWSITGTYCTHLDCWITRPLVILVFIFAFFLLFFQGSPTHGGQKVWQKNKKKGKKARTQKHQSKKEEVKQKKNSLEEKEKTIEEKEGQNGKKNKTKLRKKRNNKVENDDCDSDDEREETDGEEDEDKMKNDKRGKNKKTKRTKPFKDESSDLNTSSFGEDEDSDAPQNDAGARYSEDEDEWDRLQADSKNRDNILDAKSKESHVVHAPYFPEEKQEWWWIYVTDRKKSELITPPQQIFNLKDEEKLELKFQAPNKPRSYHYTVMLRSDSYLNVDVQKTFDINVEQAKEVNTKQWDFESDEEDKDDLDESGESEEEEYTD
ncbi:PREDICTED: translocation protein SEC63 homolog [Acropora digitifera]|uniref:translocation protein SEC63 homolog n=1 Tax=Acropora digitifera TaxID=70779 RepID=UPI00077B0B96|nr:PREDICTED: translocation protein SEC63 homolog [Acropora digitifera]